MTVDEGDINDSFRGLMQSLNLDENQFKNYDIEFETLSFPQLSAVKSEMESQLDMDTALLSGDGYPRNDIDVVSIRLIRVKVIRLRNDYKKVLELLEKKLVEQLGRSSTAQVENEIRVPETPPLIPFALVKEVAFESPAFNSGLEEGDKIILFDNDIHVRNHDKLASISRRVSNRIDQPIKVEILRNEQQQSLELTPTNNWNGRGVLGCRIIPL
ncbi:hypothetical protein QCA50_018822 [Cerrena zonata]|uniref:Probable 26S proteasome regulatory subunit p27 n=1 Tax=Cerrena zonata TaxID=2478898 RepID=A0AAW0FFA1_9APHY